METTPDSPGGRVAANLRELRARRRLTVRDLSARLAELGQPVLPSGVTKIEGEQRRVDADDLVALALALDVTPNRLLLTAGAGKLETIRLTPVVQASEAAAWRWAVGERPMIGLTSSSAEGVADFERENRPHDPPDHMTVQELADMESRGELAAFRDAYAAARAAGLTPGAARAYLQMLDRREA